jgi:hypothetical protein
MRLAMMMKDMAISSRLSSSMKRRVLKLNNKVINRRYTSIYSDLRSLFSSTVSGKQLNIFWQNMSAASSILAKIFGFFVHQTKM